MPFNIDALQTLAVVPPPISVVGAVFGAAIVFAFVPDAAKLALFRHFRAA